MKERNWNISGRMTVTFEWDSELLGRNWFNIDNLKLCLFSKEYIRKDLLEVTQKEPL